MIEYGTHADVFHGTYEDQPVALKRLRVFLQTPDPSAYHNVRRRQEFATPQYLFSARLSAEKPCHGVNSDIHT
jgi:hypothetical protein